MVNPPILAMPDFKKTFIVETDASEYGLGAVLMQDNRPLAFFSKLLGPQTKHKSVYEKELTAMCLAIEKWKHYLLGRYFIVRTDQQSLRHLMVQREVNIEYQKWVRKLIGFNFEVLYKSGVSNRVADALSRKNGTEVILGALVTTTGVKWDELQKEIEQDTTIQDIKKGVQDPDKNYQGFHMLDGTLRFKGRYVIPRT